MKRRTFILGVGATAAGGSALLGSGAFSRVESHRNVTIQVAEDPDAYLGLAKCDTPNGSYAHLDDHGHLRVFMDDENPTLGDSPLGTGVNSNSRTWFDNVFQIRNQGKEDACIYIADHEDWPTWGGEGAADEKDGEERRVQFYLGDRRGDSLVGEENQFPLALGESVCVGIRTTTMELGVDDVESLLEEIDDTVEIVADVDCTLDPEEPVPPEENDCLDCSADGDAARLAALEIENTGDEKEIEVRQRIPGPPGTTTTLFGPENVGPGGTFQFPIFTTGPSDLGFYVDGGRIDIDHADDNAGDDLHVSCSKTVRTGTPLYRGDSSQPGNDLVVVAGLDKDENCINTHVP